MRTTAQLALPLIIGQLSAIGMSLVDAMLAGHYGAHTLGAVAVGTSLWSLAATCAYGVMLALPPSVAQLDGAGRRDHVGPLFQQALWLALGLGIVLFFALRFGAPHLVRIIGVAPSLLADVNDFVHAIAWGTPALALYFALRGLPEGLSVTRPTMLVGFTGLTALAPIGYVLMYGKLGLPALGARGSGIATATVIWLMALAMGGYVALSPRYRQLGWPARWPAPHLSSIGKLLRLGAPMGISVLMESSLFVAVALAIGTLGEDVVAAHQVALNVAAVAFMVPLGLAMAITIRVGRAAGRGDVEGVRIAGRAGLLLVLATQCVSSGLMLGLPHWIAGLYSNDAAVVGIAAQLLVLAGVFQFSDGIQVASNGALRGLKDTRVPMFITAFAYWLVGMPLGAWLAFGRGHGARGMWMGLIAGLSAAAILLFLRFRRLSRRPQHWRDLPVPPPDPIEVI
jgi:MATE family multidrug resistance protein